MYVIIGIVVVVIVFIFYDRYSVREFDNLLTDEECDILISYAIKLGLSESAVLSNNLEKETTYDVANRTSKVLWVRDEEHDVAMKVAKLAEQLTGLPIENQESLQIAKYDVGGKFNSHYDACNTGTQEYRNKINRNAGQRRATLLIYLNDDFEGGETVFNKIGLTVKPKKGKGILFWNTTRTEKILIKSMHCGRPVISGEKWICTKWSHPLPYPI